MNVIISLLTYALAAVAILLGTLCYYLNSNFDYWKKRGVPYSKPKSFFGNAKEFILLKKSMAEVMTNLYHQFEGQRFAGIFMSRTPSLLLIDPDLIKNVLVKDFSHFQDRGHCYDETKDPLAAHLFNLGGSKWRKLRTKMTPTFTSGKMKMMFQLMEECSSQLQTYLADVATKEQAVELREVLAKFTTDVIGTCAFGLQMNSMSDGESEFRKMGKKVFDPSVANDIRRFVGLLIPVIGKFLRVRLVSEETTSFFINAVKETIVYREKNDVKRNDFMQLLIQMRNGKLEQEYDPLINNNFLDSQGQKNGFTTVNGKVSMNGFASQNGHVEQNGNAFKNGDAKNGHAMLKENALQNGHVQNGHVQNGHIKNGLQNGHAIQNGHIQNGHAIQNGHIQNGHIKNGIAIQNGHIQNGYMQNGHVQNGHVQNGHILQNGNMKNRADEDEDLELSDNLLAAQAFVFFLAGFETSATTMSFALHELAVNPDIQTKLREEVDATLEKCGGRFTYDAIQEMEYLDKVLSESLRKYPPGHLLVRQCTKDYPLPGSPAVLQKGVRAVVPVYALHHDAKYYPEPERFDPERFSPEEKARRPPFVYLPFGEGPRLCIGMRFGLLQAKVGLAALIARYEFHVCERTSIPITIEPRTIVTTAKGGVWLRVAPRT